MSTIVSALEQVIVLASRSDDVVDFASGVRQLDDQIARILRYVDVALMHAGEDEVLRADLEEIRGAARRAIAKTKQFRLSVVAGDAA